MKTIARTIFLAIVLGACGGPEPIGDDAGGIDAYVPPEGDGSVAHEDSGAPDHDGGHDDDAGPPDAGSSCTCDDGVACTLDRCTSEGCVHEPIHHRCDPGSFCGPGGCAPGDVCSSDADCPSDDDACTQRMRCDLGLRQCTWEILDGDEDGYAPSVCGGLDCADATPEVSPDASETCNGIDDDCDGVVDGADADAGCGTGLSCVAGECVCPSGQEFCGEALGCRVLSGDPLTCGTCATACRTGALCDTGECHCPSGTAECSDACAVLASDPAHCGACDVACAPGALCTSGSCACPSGTTECSEGCLALDASPTHCGACDLACLDGASCAASTCSSAIESLIGFQVGAPIGGSSSIALSVDGLLTHPSGETTLLISFSGALDELPFDPIASGPAVYLTRRSSLGEELWSRLITASSGSLSFSLVGRPDREDFALAGNLTSTTDFGSGSVTGGSFSRPIAVVKYDAAGAPSWTRLIPAVDPSSGGPSIIEAVMHADGAVSLIASLNDPADFGGAIHGSTACCTRWAVATYAAADGSRVASWELPMVGSNGVRAAAIGVDGSGNVVVGGSYTGGAAVFGSVILPGPSATFLAIYAPSGALMTAFVVPAGASGFTSSFRGEPLAVAAGGDMFVIGSMPALTCFAPDGTTRWALPPVDTTATTWFSPSWVDIGRDGNLLVRGRQHGHYDFGAGPFASGDGNVMAIYRPDGTFVRARGIGTEGTRSTTYLTGFGIGASGSWIAAGGFSDRLTVQDRTLQTTATLVSPRTTVPGAYLLSFRP